MAVTDQEIAAPREAALSDSFECACGCKRRGIPIENVLELLDALEAAQERVKLREAMMDGRFLGPVTCEGCADEVVWDGQNWTEHPSHDHDFKPVWLSTKHLEQRILALIADLEAAQERVRELRELEAESDKFRKAALYFEEQYATKLAEAAEKEPVVQCGFSPECRANYERAEAAESKLAKIAALARKPNAIGRYWDMEIRLILEEQS